MSDVENAGENAGEAQVPVAQAPVALVHEPQAQPSAEPKINPVVADLSHWDDVQDGFEGAARFPLWGIINKVTDGVGNVDTTFGVRRSGVIGHGLLYGAYHFGHTGRVEQQAEWYLQHIGDHEGLLLALDHEQDEQRHTHMALDEVKTWLTYVHDRVGRWPWLYSGNVIREQLGEEHSDPFWGNIKLWLAEYGSHEIIPPAFRGGPVLWQYTGDGSGPQPHNVPGIVIHGGKGIDLNHWAGTREELAAVWAA